jgi:hypothetical protein
MPTARASAVAIVESKVIYVIGGWNGIFSGPSLTTVEGYNPATDTWTEEAPLLVGKWGASRPAASTGIQSGSPTAIDAIERSVLAHHQTAAVKRYGRAGEAVNRGLLPGRPGRRPG